MNAIYGNDVPEHAATLLERGRVWEAIECVFSFLRNQWKDLPREAWFEYCRDELRSHPIRDYAHACPLTRRCFEKPRGYAGDAVMLDHIYGIEGFRRVSDRVQELFAEEIYRYTTNAPASRAVRYRRRYLASLIDAAAAQKPNEAQVLAIASGHFREAAISQALRGASGALKRVVAFDQDRESLAVVDRDYKQYGVETCVGSVKHLVSGKIGFSDFDLVYAAGLFDYLGDALAQKMVELMFGMLRPGGKILVANFLPGIPDVGYMEGLMDWHLTYRTPEQMRSLARQIPEEDIHGIRIFNDPEDNIVFMEIGRR